MVDGLRPSTRPNRWQMRKHLEDGPGACASSLGSVVAARSAATVNKNRHERTVRHYGTTSVPRCLGVSSDGGRSQTCRYHARVSAAPRLRG